MERCTRCEDTGREYFITAYGDILCEDCWDDYICTDEGKVEYLIGICKGDYPPQSLRRRVSWRGVTQLEEESRSPLY